MMFSPNFLLENTSTCDMMAKLVIESTPKNSSSKLCLANDAMHDSGVSFFDDFEDSSTLSCSTDDWEISSLCTDPSLNSPEHSRNIALSRPSSCKRPSSEDSDVSHKRHCRDLDASEERIKDVLNRDDNGLTGDFSKPNILPTIEGKHKDLNCISPDTMSRLLNDEFSHSVENFIIVDCRYPYEFDGGHIPNAINLWNHDSLLTHFYESCKTNTPTSEGKRTIIIFHCEFSSERGPKMSRFLRQADRDANKDTYPCLNFPEMYLLEGGYKAFYESHADLCQPQSYMEMLHTEYTNELKFYRGKAKSLKHCKTSKHKRSSARKLKL